MKVDFEKLRFVVVDDNAHMRRIIRTLLRSFGAREIFEAEDGASGLEAVENNQPDILITDIKMPLLDGIELTQMIRNPNGPKFKTIPIIILTAYSERRNIIQAREAGATEFLCKPVSAAGLYKRIQNIILNPRPFIKTDTFFGPCRRRNIDPGFGGADQRSGNDEDYYYNETAVSEPA